jgi:non-ribosomal peptide synthetase component F
VQGNRYPASLAQQRLWQAGQRQEVAGQSFAVRVRGPLDSALLERALSAVVARHAVLRTHFSCSDDVLEQIVAPDTATAISVFDLTALPPGERELEFLRRAVGESRRPFDLTVAPPWRCRLFRFDAGEHVLHLVIHPLLADRHSLRLLVRELAHSYTAEMGAGQRLAALETRYSSYCVEQRRRLEGNALAEHVEFWRKQLMSGQPTLPLRTRSEPDAAGDTALTHIIGLPPILHERLNDIARSEGVELRLVLLAAWQALLQRGSDTSEVIVAMPVEDARTEGVVGSFSSLLAVRLELDDNPTFRTLLRRLRDLWQTLTAHQEVSCDLRFDGSASAELPILFAFEEVDDRPITAGTFTWDLEELPGRGLPAELGFLARVGHAGLHLAFAYRTRSYDPATIQRMAGHFQNLMAGIAHDPDRRLGQFALLTPAERYQILSEWNATRSRYAENDCLQQLLEEQAERYPDRPAIVDERSYLTFAEMNRRANRLARHLRDLGIGPETLVGVAVERPAELPSVLLAVLKAGGAFVPLDVTASAQELAAILADCQPTAIVAQGELHQRLQEPAGGIKLVHLNAKLWRELEQLSDQNVELQTQPNHLASVIYPSTQETVGVMLEHRSLVSHVTTAGDYCRLTPADRVVQSSNGANSTVEEVLGSLTRAATLVFPPPAALANLPLLLKECRRCEITVARLTPAQWQRLIADLPSQARLLPSSIRLVMAEATCLNAETVALWRRHAPPHVRLVGRFGSAETTFTALLGDRAGPAATKWSDEDLALGRPGGNYQAYVVSRDLQPVPVGVTGELLIGGVGIARGYWRRAELTAERFLVDPFGSMAGARLFRIGKRVRWRADGILEMTAD